MCGIAGILSLPADGAHLGGLAKNMADQLVHRGPDHGGIWVDSNTGIALAHRRLSILELSAEGNQPMHSSNGRFVIAYNGEVYNFPELREILSGRGHEFHGGSDTEVILAAIVEWGLEDAVRRFVGMFAFALWDRQDLTLHLVRDRLGKKPLYYAKLGEQVVFASELKALRSHPDFQFDVDRSAVAELLRHNYILHPRTIHPHCFNLPPGTIVSIDTGNRALVPPAPYWSAIEVAHKGLDRPYPGDFDEARQALDVLLRTAVRQRMAADVPLGAFLSGGVDSSLVVAMMQAQSNDAVKTFTIGFEESEYDEAGYAAEVADYLGTDHTEHYVTPDEALAVIEKIPHLYDEPFSDSSQIPTYLVSKLAKAHVTVALSGDGGDELFGGYSRYFMAQRIWRRVGWLTGPGRRLLGSALQLPPPGFWDSVLAPARDPDLRGVRGGQLGDRIHKLGSTLSSGGRPDLYRQLVSHWKDPRAVVPGSTEPQSCRNGGRNWAKGNFVDQMMLTDTLTYLPGDILTKVDRASMGVSLETRAPLLDHRVFEFAWTLPQSMKVRGGEGKILLRRVLHDYIPRNLIDRPKKGFGVPIGEWLRGPLKGWADNLLDAQRLRDEGFLNSEPIHRRWEEHRSGERNWQGYLWDVLMFQLWLEHHSHAADSR